MSESDIDMDRCLLGIDDEKAWVPEIIWNNCAEQMPPDDFRYRVILKRSRKLEAMSGQEVHDVAARRNSNKLTMQWTEFTREKWEALNK